MQLCTRASPRRHKINYCRCLSRSCLRNVCLCVDIMRVFSGILIQLGQLVNSKQLMVWQDNILSQDARVIQEGLSSPQLYVQINQRLNVLHVELYIKLENALQHHQFVSNVTNKAIFSRLCQSTTISTPSSNRNTRGSWCSRGRGIPNVLCMKLKCLNFKTYS